MVGAVGGNDDCLSNRGAGDTVSGLWKLITAIGAWRSTEVRYSPRDLICIGGTREFCPPTQHGSGASSNAAPVEADVDCII